MEFYAQAAIYTFTQETPVWRLEPTNYSYKAMREILLIEIYWIPDKFLFRLSADTKFSGMTGE
jgi:hypothetical protein